MKELKHVKRFNEVMTDVNIHPKHSVGEKVKTKQNIDNVLRTHYLYLINDNARIEDYLGEECVIENVVYDNEHNYYRYLIDIDNGDYWWVDECFE